jgi:hypothetical protein
MAKQSNHLPPTWIEHLYVSANEDYSREMVISRCVPEKDTQRELTKIYRELKEAKFENLIYSSRKVVKNRSSNFNKVSIISATREFVMLYLEYNEMHLRVAKPRQVVRMVKVKDLNDSIVKSIESIRKQPGCEYTGHIIKEYCDASRIKRILWAHFCK